MDKMKIEILDNGNIKVYTDKISGPNHMNAESFFRFLTEQMGGSQTRVRKNASHSHTHEHEELNQ